MQKKAKLILTLGFLLIPITAALLYLWLDLQAQAADRPNVRRLGGITISIYLAIISLPSLGIGYWAMSFPKITDRKCKKCGWHKRYLVNTGGMIVKS